MKISKAAFVAVAVVLSLFATPALANAWKMDPLSKQVTVIQQAQELQDTDRREMLCFALAIYHESKSLKPKDMKAVGHVIQNRINDPKYPKTACGVVWQSGQFTWTARPVGAIIPREQKAWIQAQEVALDLGPDFTQGAISFYNLRTDKPRWRGLRVTLTLGSHVFLARK